MKKYQEAKNAKKAKEEEEVLTVKSPRGARAGVRGTQSQHSSPRHSRKKSLGAFESPRHRKKGAVAEEGLKSAKKQSRGRSTTLSVGDESGVVVEEREEKNVNELKVERKEHPEPTSPAFVEVEIDGTEIVVHSPVKEQKVLKKGKYGGNDSLFVEEEEMDDSDESLNVDDENFLIYSMVTVGTALEEDFEMTEDESYDSQVDQCVVQ